MATTPATDLIPAAIAAALTDAGIDPDKVTEAPDGTTVVVDLGEDDETMCLGWTDTEHPDFPEGADPAVVDWTIYSADHAIEQQDSGSLTAAVARAHRWALAAGGAR